MDCQGRFLDYESSNRDFYSSDDFRGKTVYEILPRNVASLIISKIDQTITTGEMQEFIYTLPIQDSGTGFYEARMLPSGDNEVLSIVRDVTEKNKMQEMMVQSEKMLSVGGLAAGMAHEINNPLAGMLQTANVLGERLKGTDLPANIKAADNAGTTMEIINNFMESRGFSECLPISRIQAIGSPILYPIC